MLLTLYLHTVPRYRKARVSQTYGEVLPVRISHPRAVLYQPRLRCSLIFKYIWSTDVDLRKYLKMIQSRSYNNNIRLITVSIS